MDKAHEQLPTNGKLLQLCSHNIILSFQDNGAGVSYLLYMYLQQPL